MVCRTGFAIMSYSETNARHSRLDQFVRRYYAPLGSFFRRRTRHSADVDDLVQLILRTREGIS